MGVCGRGSGWSSPRPPSTRRSPAPGRSSCFRPTGYRREGPRPPPWAPSVCWSRSQSSGKGTARRGDPGQVPREGASVLAGPGAGGAEPSPGWWGLCCVGVTDGLSGHWPAQPPAPPLPLVNVAKKPPTCKAPQGFREPRGRVSVPGPCSLGGTSGRMCICHDSLCHTWRTACALSGHSGAPGALPA